MKHKSGKPPQAKPSGAPPTQVQAQASLALGLALHQQGQLTEARASYLQVLKLQPRHFDAMHLLGVIAAQTRNFAQALEWFDQAIAVNAGHAFAFNNRGNVLRDLRQPEAAVASYDQAIALNADYAEAHNSRGNALMDLAKPRDALDSFDKAIAVKADYAEAHTNRGNALLALRRAETAIESYSQAIALKPDYAEAYSNRGAAFAALNQFSTAIDSYDQAIVCKPDYAQAYFNRGNAFRELKQPQAALENYDKAIALKVDYAQAYNNRGSALRDLGRLEAALESYDKAVALRANDAKAHNNRGNALSDMRQFRAALESYDRAIAVKPDYAEAYNNRGSALRDLQQSLAAMACYDKAIALQPDFAKAHLNRSLCMLQMGDFERGWESYEWRWKDEALQKSVRQFSQPLWLGAEPLHGKTILLHAEQGFGDTLQFCRYAKRVNDLGARVILEVQAPLAGLLAQLDGVAHVLKRGEPLPAFDCHCPLLSLPLAFRTRFDNLPVAVSYLAPLPGTLAPWAARLGEKSKPRVGLVWSGSATHKNDRNRSVRLLEWLKFLPEGLQYVSLQKETRTDDKETLAQNPRIGHFDEDIKDFSDTAALCALMDVVVSVDTSVAHLACALGKPAWIVLPLNPDWRWLLQRSDSPWYPSATLYRQQTAGDWDGVFRRISADLGQLAGPSLSPLAEKI
ncbi:tetratricopeptide repeat protein [Polaromonas sp.]|uniref:tetratricopeptide repeat protein n=1 Tax=Polaromonas sp. TaxID=1869339 RepID=UPI0037510DCC